jgi:hypothetical protein
MIDLLFRFLVGHALADYALQSDFIATNKNRNATPKGYDPNRHGPMQKVWPFVLSSHALIHGGAAYIACGGILWVGIVETISHWFIDFGKCEKWYGIKTDQALHLAFKLFYVGMLL